MSLLGETMIRFGAPGMHAFGVEFNLENKKRVESDVVAYLGHPDWVIALGEVKNRNRIDLNDVQNLELLQRRLDESRVRSVLVFTTLKDGFGPDEVAILRQLVERGRLTSTPYLQFTPRLPLVLTARDLSRPRYDEDHPMRWGQPGSGQNIFAIAMESCKRNLGLADLQVGDGDAGQPFGCTWQEIQGGAVQLTDAQQNYVDHPAGE